MGYVLQSSFGKYLLVETEDKDGAEAEQMPDEYGADDYHDNGTNHTHDDYHEAGYPHTHGPIVNDPPLTLEDLENVKEKLTTPNTLEAGQDYHDTGYYHTHSPDSREGNIESGNDSHSTEDDGSNEAISKTLEDLLAKIPTKKRTGKDYHDTGFAHTHSPKARRNNKHTRNKKRTPKRMRPRWSNVH